jgi:beta-N-acetylglucosaminidase
MKRSYANNRKTAILLAIAMMAAVFSVSKNAVASIAESGQYAVVTAGTLVKAGILADAENPGDPENPGGNENPGDPENPGGNGDPGNENPGNEDPGDITPGGEVTPSAEVTPSEELSPSPSPTNSPSPEPTPIPTTPPTPTDSPTPTVSPTPTLSPTPSPSPSPTPEGTAGYVNVAVELDVYNETQGELRDAKGYNIQLTPGTRVRILEAAVTIGGKTYSKIKFDYNGQTGLVGYVDPSLLATYAEIDTGDPEYLSYIESLKADGFPESYCESLYILHTQHPTWVFKAYNTGLTWNDVVNEECSEGRCVIKNTKPSSWKSTAPGDYLWMDPNGNDGGYKKHEDGSWNTASKELVAYCLDPRNFLSERAVFMFEKQAFNPDLQTEEGVQSMLVGSHMEGAIPGENTTYAKVLMEAAETSGVSPYFLAARIFQEVGRTKVSDSASGKNSSYPGYYNYYNINATGSKPITNGLAYAKKMGWNTRRKAIIGGAAFLSNDYIKIGQDTLYLQKFNVTPKNTYGHQYMTNVTAPSQEASLYYTNLTKDHPEILETAFVFSIPVYSGMPDKACARPVGDGNPNGYLKELSIGDEDLTPDFSYQTLSYDVVVGPGTTSLTISAKAIVSTTKVSGTGKVSLAPGNNYINIDCTAGNGNVIRYVIHVFRKETTETILSDRYDLTEERIRCVPLGTEVSTFLQNVTVTGSSKVVVVNPKGEVMTSGYVGSGCCLKTDDYKIPIIIYGDASGDGVIDAVDLLYLRRHLLEVSKLTGAAALAADVQGEDGINAVDLLYLRRHILNITLIKQPEKK